MTHLQVKKYESKSIAILIGKSLEKGGNLVPGSFGTTVHLFSCCEKFWTQGIGYQWFIEQSKEGFQCGADNIDIFYKSHAWRGIAVNECPQ